MTVLRNSLTSRPVCNRGTKDRCQLKARDPLSRIHAVSAKKLHAEKRVGSPTLFDDAVGLRALARHVAGGPD